MILAELEPARHRISVASAGHETPLLRRANGTVEQVELPGRGLPLGISANEAYAPTSLELEPGDVLVLYSDGLKDALDRHRNPFGMERVQQTLGHAPAVSSLAGEALLEAVMRHSEGVAPFDDLTIVCVGREMA